MSINKKTVFNILFFINFIGFLVIIFLGYEIATSDLNKELDYCISQYNSLVGDYNSKLIYNPTEDTNKPKFYLENGTILELT